MQFVASANLCNLKLVLEEAVNNFAKQDERGQTLLHMAARSGDTSIIKTAENSMTDEQWYKALRIQDSEGHSVLTSGIEHPDVVATILNKDRTHRLQKNLLDSVIDDEEFLYKAAKGGLTDVVKIVLKSMPSSEYKRLLKRQYEDGNMLHIAAQNGDMEFINSIIQIVKPEVDVDNLLKEGNSSGQTIIHLACLKKDNKVVEDLLELVGSDKVYEILKVKTIQVTTAGKVRMTEGKTALHYAALLGNVSIIEEMMRFLTPEQQKRLLSKRDGDGHTAKRFALNNNERQAAECLKNFHGGSNEESGEEEYVSSDDEG